MNAEFWNQFDAESFGPYAREWRITEYLEQLAIPADQTVSFMCGPTSFVPADLGVDISDVLLDLNTKIRKRLIHDFNSGEQLPIADNSYQLATLISGIAYLQNPINTFKDIHRTLREDGILVLGFDDIYVRNYPVLPEWKNAPHLIARANHAAQLLQAAQFTEEHREYFEIDYRNGIIGKRPYYCLMQARKVTHEGINNQ